jgi:hypothetical protein
VRACCARTEASGVIRESTACCVLGSSAPGHAAMHACWRWCRICRDGTGSADRTRCSARSRPSRERAAPWRARIAAVPSSAEPGHADTRACCSNASTRRAGGRTRHGLIPPLEAQAVKPLVHALHGWNSRRPAFLRTMIVRADCRACMLCKNRGLGTVQRAVF